MSNNASLKIFALAILVALLICLTLAGCNRQVIDLTYKFDRAVIFSPTGILVEGKVDSWTDYKDSDQVQVKINGKTYFTHSENVVLIKE